MINMYDIKARTYAAMISSRDDEVNKKFDPDIHLGDLQVVTIPRHGKSSSQVEELQRFFEGKLQGKNEVFSKDLEAKHAGMDAVQSELEAAKKKHLELEQTG